MIDRLDPLVAPGVEEVLAAAARVLGVVQNELAARRGGAEGQWCSVERGDLAQVEREFGEQRARFRAAEHDLTPAAPGLERALELQLKLGHVRRAHASSQPCCRASLGIGCTL